MAATDLYTVSGSLTPARSAIKCLGGNVDDYIQVDAFAAAQVAAGDTTGTFTAWICPGDVGTETIIGCGDKNVVEFIELNVELGKLVARCTDNTTVQFVVTSDAVIVDNLHRWVHVALVQGGVPQLYVNGERIAQTNTTSTNLAAWFGATAGIDSGRIGAANKAGDDSVTQEFSGAISDVKYWDTALTDEQVRADFQGTDNETNLISHWPFKIGLTDIGTGGYDGTNVGAGIIQVSGYSTLSSKLAFVAGAPVVADKINIWADGGIGYASVLKAA